MLTRRILMIATLSVAMMAGPVLAATIAEDVAAQLQDQGYTIASVERTLLGRTRIIAVKNGQEREIILNGRTGEILRDFLKRASSDDDEPTILAPRDSGNDGSGSGSGDGDDNGDDGGNSGSGGGQDDAGDSDDNSGSGGGGDDGGSDEDESDDSNDNGGDD